MVFGADLDTTTYYCALCGVHLIPTAVEDDPRSLDPPQWLTELRAVTNDSVQTKGKFVTNLGFLDGNASIDRPTFWVYEEDRPDPPFPSHLFNDDEDEEGDKDVGRNEDDQNDESEDEDDQDGQNGQHRGCVQIDMSYDQFQPTHPTKIRWYLMHNACWKILLNRILDDQDLASDAAVSELAKAVFDILNCTPVAIHSKFHHGGGFSFGGASAFWEEINLSEARLPTVPPSSSRSWNQWDFLHADPRGGISLKKFTGKIDLTTSQNLVPKFKPKWGAGASRDPFASLPADLRLELLKAMDSRDILVMCAASRVIATTCQNLPQDFWKSRFMNDRATKFFLWGGIGPPAPLPRLLDWRSLYQMVQKKLWDRSLRGGSIRNRQRIWYCLNMVEAAIKYLLKARRTSDEDRSEPVPFVRGMRVFSADYQLDQTAPGLIMSLAPDQTWEEQIFFPPVDPNRAVTFALTILPLHPITTYFSGMQILSTPADSKEPVSSDSISMGCIGKIDPMTWTRNHIRIEPGEELFGLEVLTMCTGIVGLRFLIQKPDQTKIESCVGFCKEGMRIGVARLMPKEGRKIVGLSFRMDACKFIAVQLLESPPESTSVETEAEKLLPAAVVWCPNLPTGLKDETSIIMPRASEDDFTLVPPTEDGSLKAEFGSRNTLSSFCLNMDFGGPRGSDLNLLSQVSVLFDTTTSEASIRGMKFYYEMKSYYEGLKECRFALQLYDLPGEKFTRFLEMPFVIQGGLGERITEMQVAHRLVGGFERVSGIRLITNMGNSQVFKAYSGQDVEGDEFEPDVFLKPEAGHTIIGMVAKIRSSSGIFRGIGIQTCRLGDDDAVPDEAPTEPAGSSLTARPPKHTLSFSGLDMLDLDLFDPNANHPYCVTSVLLDNIKCIRIHTDDASPRAPGHAPKITGFHFEFWDSPQAVIVGQANVRQFVLGVFSLRRDERITHIITRHTKMLPPHRQAMRPPPRIWTAPCGPMKIVEFMTSRGTKRAYRVGQDNLNSLHVQRFAANPYEKLSAIIWAFRHNSETFTIANAPRTVVTRIIPDPSWRRTSRVRHRLFWKVLGSDNRPVDLVSIAGFFTGTRLAGLAFHYMGGLVKGTGAIMGDHDRVVSQFMCTGNVISKLVFAKGKDGSIRGLAFYSHILGTQYHLGIDYDIRNLPDSTYTEYHLCSQTATRGYCPGPHRHNRSVPPLGYCPKELNPLPQRGPRFCAGIEITMGLERPGCETIYDIKPIFVLKEQLPHLPRRRPLVNLFPPGTPPAPELEDWETGIEGHPVTADEIAHLNETDSSSSSSSSSVVDDGDEGGVPPANGSVHIVTIGGRASGDDAAAVALPTDDEDDESDDGDDSSLADLMRYDPTS